jgi:hypothetical protein
VNRVSRLAYASPFEQATLIGHVPRVVRVPTVHVLLTPPLDEAALSPSPLALDGPDA